MFVQYLGGELRFKSFPWFKTEAIFNFPIKLMMMPKTKKELTEKVATKKDEPSDNYRTKVAAASSTQ